MTNRVMFAIQKGGVGKSTSTVAVSEILAAAGYRVLVVDMDPQGNASKMLTGNSIYQYSGRTIMEAIQEGDAMPYIINTKENLDIIPAEDRLATFSQHIYAAKVNNPYAVLKRLLEPVEELYDFVFIDVGPNLGDAVVNAIVYARHIIVPVDLGDLSMDAMVRFIEFVEEIKAEGRTEAEIAGLLLTMKDSRSRYEREVAEGIRAAYGPLVFKSEIRRRVKIKEMSANGVDIVSDAMEDYMALTEEILNRVNGKEEHHE